MDITSAAIATIISATTSATVSLVLAKLNSKKHLDDQLDAILKIAVQFPYLECEEFADQWTSSYDRENEKFLRYEVYCTLIFNYLSRVGDFYKYDAHKIEKYLAAKSWVRLHAKYWNDPSTAYENVDSYEQPFVKLIEGYLNGRNHK